MRGILFAEESAASLRPITLTVPKPLVPVYDKPMIYFPLSVLLMAGIREILLISTPRTIPWLQKLLGDGSQWGINLSYALQPSTAGSAEVFLSGAEFIGVHSVAVIFADNLFYGPRLDEVLLKTVALKKGARTYAYHLKGTEKYETNPTGSKKMTHVRASMPDPSSLECMMTNLYFYDESAVIKVRELASIIGEKLEITELNQAYLAERRFDVDVLDQQHMFWCKMCTADSLYGAAKFVYDTEIQQGTKICCPEEICWRRGYINDSQLETLCGKFQGNGYGQYLLKILEEGKD